MDVRIIGVGNVLMGDEGVGPFVVRMLEAKYLFPADVTLVDAGTPGVDLVPLLADADVAIVVDAAQSSQAPGTVRVYDRQALLKPAVRRSACDELRVTPALQALSCSARSPKEVVVIGVVPQWVATGTHLSDTAQHGAQRAMDRVLYELERIGLHARLNPESVEPNLWWEQAATP